jgi:hypothetical protein
MSTPLSRTPVRIELCWKDSQPADEKEYRPELVALNSTFSVELPGIESATEIALSSGNAGFHDAKRREST